MIKEKDYDSFIGIAIMSALIASSVYLGVIIKERSVKTLCEESGYFTYKNNIYACYKEDMSIYKVEGKQ